jgi:hypothetical protein
LGATVVVQPAAHDDSVERQEGSQHESNLRLVGQGGGGVSDEAVDHALAYGIDDGL